MKNRIRIGLIGAGFAASFHVECLRRIYGADIELTGITSLRAESRDKFGAEHGIDVYTDVESMLNNIDVLDICTPPYVHEAGILAACSAGKGIMCEKPLTGCFGPENADDTYHGDQAPKRPMLEEAITRTKRIAEAVRESNVFFGYAENYVYAPSIQKEREIIEKTDAQILRMIGDESHNGSGSSAYGIWRLAGGGSLMGKGCHPLGGMLYLKQVEGLARDGNPIRPVAVSARTHQLTRLPNYRDAGFIRTDYHDIEDYGIMHVVFEDGTLADAIASEIVLGGLQDYVEVFANNHRTKCHISPTGLMDTYNPKASQYEDIYVMEKISSKEGWSQAAPDENITVGYQPEMQDFVTCMRDGKQPQSGLNLAVDITAVIYAAYVSDEEKGREIEVPRL